MQNIVFYTPAAFRCQVISKQRELTYKTRKVRWESARSKLVTDSRAHLST